MIVGLRRFRIGHGPCSARVCFTRVLVHGLFLCELAYTTVTC
jgi:hypothetical protein